MGGKRRLAKHLIPLFPEHQCYVELFAGGAALFFLRPEKAKTEVLNDLNGGLINLYRVVQHHFDEFVRQFEWTLTSREVFARLQATPPESMTDIQRAARFFYLQHTAFGGKVTDQHFGTATTGRGFNAADIAGRLKAPTAARRRVYRIRAVAALPQTLRPAAHLLLRRPAILANRRLRPRLRLAAVSAAGRHDGHGKRQSDAVYQRPPRYPQAVWQLPHRAARTGLFSRARQNAKNQRRAGHLQLVVLQQAKQKGHGRPFLSNLREQYRGHQI